MRGAGRSFDAPGPPGLSVWCCLLSRLSTRRRVGDSCAAPIWPGRAWALVARAAVCSIGVLIAPWGA
eukprot:1955729-Alexandrium_andersonii.AAC.1